jgi:hypothetical protein
MNFTRDRVRSIGWAFVLTVCFALTMGLMMRVNAVKSEVRLTERQIVALKREKVFLETEFETRANQQQLRALNDIEFGYVAPSARQYLDGERQLAALGKPAGPGAPTQVRVASARTAEEDLPFPMMVSPLTGKAMAAETGAGTQPEIGARPLAAAGLSHRLARTATDGESAAE